MACAGNVSKTSHGLHRLTERRRRGQKVADGQKVARGQCEAQRARSPWIFQKAARAPTGRQTRSHGCVLSALRACNYYFGDPGAARFALAPGYLLAAPAALSYLQAAPPALGYLLAAPPAPGYLLSAPPALGYLLAAPPALSYLLAAPPALGYLLAAPPALGYLLSAHNAREGGLVVDIHLPLNR
jgi:hypothetical protein